MCSNFQELNNLTIKDKFPILVINDLFNEIHGYQYFTKLDLHPGHHQIQMKVEDIPKTSFCTHEGHYEFLVMHFGICNAPYAFQILMNKIMKPYLQVFFLFFFDDILIYSTTWEYHLQHLSKILQIFWNHHWFFKKSKCLFGVQEVKYLVHIVVRDGVQLDPKKIQDINYWPHPKTLKILKGILSLIEYYRKFVCNYGKIVGPFTRLLKKNYFNWDGLE